jgi:hypothetical protein
MLTIALGVVLGLILLPLAIWLLALIGTALMGIVLAPVAIVASIVQALARLVRWCARLIRGSEGRGLSDNPAVVDSSPPATVGPVTHPLHHSGVGTLAEPHRRNHSQTP